MLVDSHRDIQSAVLERVKELYALAASQAGAKAGKGDFDAEPYEQKIKADGPCRRVLKSDRELKYGRRQFSAVLKALTLMAKRSRFPRRPWSSIGVT